MKKTFSIENQTQAGQVAFSARLNQIKAVSIKKKMIEIEFENEHWFYAWETTFRDRYGYLPKEVSK